jgi:mannitol-1-/sugar-/sorbitol-6-/2-deoxyglucose-6-phosphatase
VPAEDVVEADTELGHERVQRADRGLRLTGFDLRDQARGDPEPSRQLSLADPNALALLLEPRPDVFQLARHDVPRHRRPGYTDAPAPVERPVASSSVNEPDRRPIDAVVFDMDGVLLDSEPIWRAVEREIFAGLGIRVTDDDLRETMGVRIADVVERWHRRHPWAEPSRAEVAAAVVDGVARRIEEAGVLHPGVRGAIDRLESDGVRLALASSSPMRLIRAVLAMGELEERFDVVVTAEGEVRGKPDPAVYLSAARALGVAPARCLAIEDSINGVRAAKAAGMVCVAIPASDNDADFGEADLVLGSLDELDRRIWERTGTVPTDGRPPAEGAD